MDQSFKNITDVPGIKVGNAENTEGLTGCTVIILEQGARCGVDVRGGGPGTRETDLLNPMNLVDQVNGVCLAGGSAYGLDAASGVMAYLEEQQLGLDVGVGIVPIVPAAVLFDLGVGSYSIRPTPEMGYAAARDAHSGALKLGNYGAGCGATVGKIAGQERAMKGGLGSSSRTFSNGLVVGALVAVNAVGEVRDSKTGEILAGIRDDNGHITESLEWMLNQKLISVLPGTNTTIGVVACNANLNKAQMNKVASMAHDGLARTIYPIHTMYDGDTIFALSTGQLEATVDFIGTIAAEVLAEAVVNSIIMAEGLGGYPSYRDLKKKNH
ncbi:peptidase S58 family protein [Sporolactobacillus sp. THM7-4]|nr:peptidase S58 family protein [Sporolactobacillus sp. THM7-4]